MPESAEGLEARLLRIGTSPSENVRLWHDGEGHLPGFAELAIISRGEDGTIHLALRFDAHPEERTDALGRQILQWAAERARAIGREREANPTIVSSLHLAD